MKKIMLISVGVLSLAILAGCVEKEFYRNEYFSSGGAGYHSSISGKHKHKHQRAYESYKSAPVDDNYASNNQSSQHNYPPKNNQTEYYSHNGGYATSESNINAYSSSNAGSTNDQYASSGSK